MNCSKDFMPICETASREWYNEDRSKSKRSVTKCGCASIYNVEKAFREY